jgi:hypothetical protein
MAYEGEILNECGVLKLDLSRVAVVAISGSGPNVCGHLILCAGPPGAAEYFQVASIHGYPRYMSESGYPVYLRQNGKRELRRVYLNLPDPGAARIYLEALLSRRWLWGILPHNCVAFVETIIKAGGGTWSSYSNCPTIATTESVQDQAARFLQKLDTEIYRLYGAPH